MNILSNREIALVFWLLSFMIYAFTIKDVRKSFGKVVKNFFSRQIQAYIIISIIYFGIILYGVNKIYHLNIGLIKDSILWFCISGLYFTQKIITNKIKDFSIVSRLKDNITFLVFIELLANTYVFPVIIEIIIVPISLFVFIFYDVAKKHKDAELLMPIINKIRTLLSKINRTILKTRFP
ncbi:hypothetical protein K7J14_14805 [Treponema zuelzerae]|uniref:Uncharacterized protein n=1 Tax=Teretinema zuelzerae TaxID=156 RepID=A0AAE3EKK1_9SPIR|nr:hypothetical protein [Teretinema zuelzerae]MCD1655966.1 hypothetical protein [Teretinema zuelzerae]